MLNILNMLRHLSVLLCLAKATEEMRDSRALFCIGAPSHSGQIEDDIGLVFKPARASDMRLARPERKPATTRDVEEEDDGIGEDLK